MAEFGWQRAVLTLFWITSELAGFSIPDVFLLLMLVVKSSKLKFMSYRHLIFRISKVSLWVDCQSEP